MFTKRKITALFAGLLTVALVPAAAFAATTVVVTGTESAGWTKNSPFADNRGTQFADVTSKYGAPIGFGSSSLEVNTLTGDDKAQVAHPLSTPVALSQLNEIAYKTFRSSSSTATSGQLPAINLVIDFNGPDVTGGFSTLVFEPIYQSGGASAISQNVWQNWDASGDAIWRSTRVIPGVSNTDYNNTYVSLNSIKAANPNATVKSYIVNQGSGNAGLLAAVDAFDFNGTISNFELKQFAATAKEDCKDGGWINDFQTNYKNQGECVSSVANKNN